MTADRVNKAAIEDNYDSIVYYENNGLHMAPNIIIENSILS